MDLQTKGTILTIDQGNSRAKATVFVDGYARASVVDTVLTVESLIPLFESYDISGVAACSTGYPDARLLETVRRMASGRLVTLTPGVSLPIDVCYGSPATLGADRIAAAAGAAALGIGAAVVADAGTALTLDVVDSTPAFRGGNISPGLALRFRSLNDYTSRLPLLSSAGDVPAVGYDTATAIRAGVVGGLLAEIKEFYAQARTRYGCRQLILTGGDAPRLGELLEKHDGLRVEPDLVGLGLVAVFNHNNNE